MMTCRLVGQLRQSGVKLAYAVLLYTHKVGSYTAVLLGKRMPAQGVTPSSSRQLSPRGYGIVVRFDRPVFVSFHSRYS